MRFTLLARCRGPGAGRAAAAKAAAFSLVTLGAIATAQPAGPPPPMAACQTCHGRDGTSIAADIPHLAGQKRDYLAAQLRAFRDGRRKNELMNAMARQLSDEQIAALAAAWSAMPAPPPVAAAAPGTPRPPAAPGTGLASSMTFPAGFPQGFREYSREQDAASQSIAIRYANAVAFDAARSGAALPDGAIVIVAAHPARLDAAGRPVLDAQGRWEPGAVQSYSGMEARAGWGESVPPLLRNANWHYGLFATDGAPRLGPHHSRCLACHQPESARSYVFTIDLLRAAARR